MFPSIPGKKNTGFGHTNSSVNPGQQLSGKTAEKERKKMNRRNYNSSNVPGPVRKGLWGRIVVD
jgi:hypothetical protein